MSAADAILDDVDSPPPSGGRRSLGRLLPFLAPHRRTVLAAGATVLVTAAGQLGGTLLLAEVVGLASRGAEAARIALGGLAALAAFLVAAGTGWFQTLLVTRMGIRIVVAIKRRVFAHVLSLGTRYHDKNPVGKLLARTENDAETMKEMFSSTAVQLAQNAVTFSGALVIMFLKDPGIAALMLLLVPVLGLGAWWFLRAMRRVYREVRRSFADLTGTVTEYVQGVPVVQHYGQEERALARLDERNIAKYRAEMKAWMLDYGFWGGFAFVEIVAMALILTVGHPLVAKGELAIEDVIIFLEFTRRVFEPIMALGEQLNQVQRGLASADRVFEVLSTVSDVEDRPGAGTAVRLARTIEFANVSFGYESGRNVVNGVSFTLKRGERIALVGPSGGGKSTLVGLLCRFLDPTSGRILVDGRDLREFTQKAWRERIGLVLQEIYLFPGTVLDNLRVFDERIDEGAVARAAAAVGADRVISRLPGGLQASLAERGSNLSLGERQILSFARALAGDPDLLILDEATSSVDPETEARIEESLGKLLEGRTAVVVAHRLQTVRRVDRILVISGGRIVEEGTHDELHARGGVYRQLHDLQVDGNGRAR